MQGKLGGGNVLQGSVSGGHQVGESVGDGSGAGVTVTTGVIVGVGVGVAVTIGGFGGTVEVGVFVTLVTPVVSACGARLGSTAVGDEQAKHMEMENQTTMNIHFSREPK